jgi:hypothetical protein
MESDVMMVINCVCIDSDVYRTYKRMLFMHRDERFRK